ncbi:MULTISPECIES: hypothetical protein [Aeromonas]|nr:MULTISPECIES: hypothetical protein [Aeromonas]PKD25063.1 hypothetical protein AO056_01545 [Aeromonas hydrophila]QTL93355.1 hypothetical protein AjGTCBM29_01200 [Aeromonas jandaei]
MEAYIVTGVLMAVMYVLGYMKGRIDEKKQKVEFVSNYGDKK